MNFLSHYYFDRHENNSERILGALLPDLLKNTDKSWIIRAERKDPGLFRTQEGVFNLMQGWLRHIHIDKIFHSSNFFMEHTAALRQIIKPILVNSEVRPSFLAHISLELMLDSVLLQNEDINIHTFYLQIKTVNKDNLASFLHLAGVTDLPRFDRFLEGFIRSGYLATYVETEKIIYALGRICERIWPIPFSDKQKEELRLALLPYLEYIKLHYKSIFDEIENKINPYTEF